MVQTLATYYAAINITSSVCNKDGKHGKIFIILHKWLEFKIICILYLQSLKVAVHIKMHESWNVINANHNSCIRVVKFWGN